MQACPEFRLSCLHILFNFISTATTPATAVSTGACPQPELEANGERFNLKMGSMTCVHAQAETEVQVSLIEQPHVVNFNPTW